MEAELLSEFMSTVVLKAKNLKYIWNWCGFPSDVSVFCALMFYNFFL